MRQLLVIGGVALGAYGVYLLLKNKSGCGCNGKKNIVKDYIVQAKRSKNGVKGNGQHRTQLVPIVKDEVRQVFDARPVATCCPSVAFPNFMYPYDL